MNSIEINLIQVDGESEVDENFDGVQIFPLELFRDLCLGRLSGRGETPLLHISHL